MTFSIDFEEPDYVYAEGKYRKKERRMQHNREHKRSESFSSDDNSYNDSVKAKHSNKAKRRFKQKDYQRDLQDMKTQVHEPIIPIRHNVIFSTPLIELREDLLAPQVINESVITTPSLFPLSPIVLPPLADHDKGQKKKIVNITHLQSSP